MTPIHGNGSTGPALRSRLFLLARTTYAVLHMAVWAFGVAVLLHLLLHWGELSGARSRALALSQAEVDNEDRMYCDKWGMKIGTHEHTLCTLDLKRLRADYERRLQDDVAGIL